MSAASDYVEKAVIEYLFNVGGNAALPRPAGIWVSLHASAPAAETAPAWQATEVAAGSGYARAATGNWTGSQVTGGTAWQVTNAAQVEFPQPSGDWAARANLTHFALWDAASGGNLLFTGALASPRPVVAGDGKPTFQAASLTVQLA
ncbi:MAG: hypothetical protein ACKOWF_01945 [Chloroflexota bacterium]